ncbi:MAG: hypothetical protein A2284_03445 [Deltaproteobacteria bacterium RIFOXYA12_FULL_61_11]|nr:MAG: hypothetical protein A2284_03445 [Deltaproteobacteria bacterium RIFOXYA12_FULL_61_11]
MRYAVLFAILGSVAVTTEGLSQSRLGMAEEVIAASLLAKGVIVDFDRAEYLPGDLAMRSEVVQRWAAIDRLLNRRGVRLVAPLTVDFRFASAEPRLLRAGGKDEPKLVYRVRAFGLVSDDANYPLAAKVAGSITTLAKSQRQALVRAAQKQGASVGRDDLVLAD